MRARSPPSPQPRPGLHFVQKPLSVDGDQKPVKASPLIDPRQGQGQRSVPVAFWARRPSMNFKSLSLDEARGRPGTRYATNTSPQLIDLNGESDSDQPRPWTSKQN